MSKCAAYSAAGIVGLIVGAIAAGVTVYFTAMPAQMEGPLSAKCILVGSGGNIVSGTINFNQESADDHLVITSNVSGLTAGKHGFHIHTLGSQNGECKMAAGHYNPHEMSHGGPNSEDRHIGDLGNIESLGESTSTVVNIKDSIASLFGADSIYGRSIVIHEGEDDLSPASSSGNAGSRVACCTIMHS